MSSKKEQFKKSLIDLTKSDRFIPGIYNYCDRWCERCTMTNKCLVYAHEQEMKEDSANPETRDTSNKNFWDQIRLSFEVMFELIQEDAERLGIDLNNVPDSPIPDDIEYPVEKLANDYGFAIHNWLIANNDILIDKAEQMLLIHNNKNDAVKLADAWEVVQWYSFFISAKTHRAHFDLNERQNEKEDEYSVFSDNLGSAKIAIIAIDRSINALSALYTILKDQEDEILNFLSQLSVIKKQLLATFPEVELFKRPGFDD